MTLHVSQEPYLSTCDTGIMGGRMKDVKIIHKQKKFSCILLNIIFIIRSNLTTVFDFSYIKGVTSDYCTTLKEKKKGQNSEYW